MKIILKEKNKNKNKKLSQKKRFFKFQKIRKYNLIFPLKNEATVSQQL